MPPPRRRRFLQDGNLEAKRAKEEKVITEYVRKPLNDNLKVTDTTKTKRIIVIIE